MNNCKSQPRPIVPMEVLKELRSSVQDRSRYVLGRGFCSGLQQRHPFLFGRHAADETGEIKPAKHGLLFMWRLYSHQSKSVLKTKVDQSVSGPL